MKSRFWIPGPGLQVPSDPYWPWLFVTNPTRSGREVKIHRSAVKRAVRTISCSSDAICQPTAVTASIRSDLKLQADDYRPLACEWHRTDVPFIAPSVLHQRHIAVTVQRETPCCLLPGITFHILSFPFYDDLRKHNDPLDIYWISVGYHVSKRWPIDIDLINIACFLGSRLNRRSSDSGVFGMGQSDHPYCSAFSYGHLPSCVLCHG